jgi:hypothetical protein
VRAVCAGLGAATGSSAAAAAFYYDGGGRVNVLLVLALFVLLPLAGIALFAVAAASRDGLRVLNAGQLGRGVAGLLLPWPGARALAALAAGSAGSRVAKWLLLYWSQWLALGFSAGALVMAFALVLFTDIAFGWATTLGVDPARIAALARTLAWPWALLAPDAVPDAALVESSRYFRLAFAGAVRADPAVLGRWWPFVVLCMLCYGVLPRLLTLLLARWRLRAACTGAALAERRVRELLDRMNTPLVQTQSPEPEQAAAPGSAAAAVADLPPAPGYQVVNWAALPLHAQRLDEVLGAARRLAVHSAGGSRSTAQDRELVRALAGADAAVLVLAKAWEPPTLELVDFIAELRAALPARHPLALAPVMVHDGAATPADAARIVTWQLALSRAGLERIDLVSLHAVRAP